VNALGRALVLGLGVVLVLGGLAAIGVGVAGSGLWATIVGMVLIIAAIIERSRYRSDEADRRSEPPGPGGGEPPGTRLDPRFAPTDEIFEDPTSGRQMRVWLDRGSGERRYVALD
jgi:hypothetical protein